MSQKPDHERLYRIAERQGGYFSAQQAAEAGFAWQRLSYHAKTGLIQRVSRGIYRLTRFPSSPFEDLFVAWLRTGPSAAISHESALAVYELSDVLPGEIHVTVPRTASRRRTGIRLHTNRLSAADVTSREGLRLTTVPRTIIDVAASGLPEDHVRQAVLEALRRGLTRRKSLRAEAERRGGRAKLVRAVLDEVHA
jgi:predicted transcriptional regulator of viral defense system